MTAAAVILAAGGGRRFNVEDPDASPGAKLVTLVKGRPLVSWAIEPALESGCDEVIVVGGAVDLSEVVPTSVTLLTNESWAQGQATSLRVALEWCVTRGHSSALVGLGDTPGLTAESWRKVLAAPGGPIVFANYDGRRGHPVRLDADVWRLLPIEGDEGARSIARERPELVSEVACTGNPMDIDTPDDLRMWK